MKSENGGLLTVLGGIVTVIGLITSIVLGIIYIATIDITIGFIIGLLGSFFSFASGALFCGLGELIDTTNRIAYYLNPKAEEKLKEEKKEFLSHQQVAEKDNWLCPECCREISNKSKECKCGYKRK